MTVAEYQRVYEINQTTPDTVERVAWIICALFKKTDEQVNDLTTKEFLKYVNKVEKKLQFKKRFPLKLQTDASKITLGQFIECQHWLKNDTIQVLHLIAASLLKKRKDHAKDAERILNKPIGSIYDQVEKFIHSFKELINSYKGLFEIEDSEGEEERDDPHPFISRYGWMFSATQVAEFEGITLDQAYELPIIQALNDLSYLKSKSQYDKWLSKK